jgi:hypothetical protein
MKGTSDVVRRCLDCGCDVVNLSALDEESARSLLAQQTATSCVRFRYVRGEVVFSRVRRAVATAAAAAVLLAAAAGSADTATPTPAPRPRGKGEPKKRPTTEKPPKKEESGWDTGLTAPF